MLPYISTLNTIVQCAFTAQAYQSNKTRQVPSCEVKSFHPQTGVFVVNNITRGGLPKDAAYKLRPYVNKHESGSMGWLHQWSSQTGCKWKVSKRAPGLLLTGHVQGKLHYREGEVLEFCWMGECRLILILTNCINYL